MIEFASWNAVPKSAYGLPDRPWCVKSFTHEYPDCAVFMLHDPADLYPGAESEGAPVFTIGSEGIQACPSEDCYRDGFNATWTATHPEWTATHPDLPATGWRIRDIRSDQTGGWCMVDVVTFENGICAAITEEIVILYRSRSDYEDQHETGDYDGLCSVAFVKGPY